MAAKEGSRRQATSPKKQRRKEELLPQPQTEIGRQP
jgi:hypothetical protein